MRGSESPSARYRRLAKECLDIARTFPNRPATDGASLAATSRPIPGQQHVLPDRGSAGAHATATADSARRGQEGIVWAQALSISTATKWPNWIAEGVAEWLKGAVLKTAHFLGPRRSFWFHSVQMAPAIGAGRRRKVRNGPNAFTPFANLSECRHRCMSSEHFGQLAWQFKRMSGSSGLKVQAAIAC